MTKCENTPALETERLLLRRFTEDDVEDLFLILSDRETNTFVPWFPAETREQARARLQEDYLKQYELPRAYRYAVALKADGRPIGYVHVSGLGKSNDLGYGLRSEYWHRGIATEACKRVVERLGEAGFAYVTATHDVNNPRSGEVMKKLGMTYRYSYRELWQPKNIMVTFRMYQLNLYGNACGTYMEYWNKYPHFIEKE